MSHTLKPVYGVALLPSTRRERPQATVIQPLELALAPSSLGHRVLPASGQRNRRMPIPFKVPPIEKSTTIETARQATTKMKQLPSATGSNAELGSNGCVYGRGTGIGTGCVEVPSIGRSMFPPFLMQSLK
jgi:hypothetical protein